MKKFGIVVDSTTYLSKKEFEDMNIHSVSLNIIDGENTVKEDEVNNKYVRDLLNNRHKLTTSQPSPGEFLATYEKLLKEGCEKVFVLTISEPLSGTYQSANLAKNMLENPEKVHVFKSIMAAFGNENLVFRLYDYINQGKSYGEIVESMERLIASSGLIITVEDLISVYKSGRLSKTKAALGTVMRIKPLIKMDNGKLDLYKAARSHKKVTQIMLEDMKKATSGFKKVYIRVQSHNSEETAKQLIETVKEHFENAEVTYNNYLGPVFNIHVGEKGYGIGWCGE